MLNLKEQLNAMSDNMLVDSHCHLDFPGLIEDVPAVRARALEAGVGLMVTISTRIRQMDKILPIAEQNENVFCSVGTHPHNASEEKDLGFDDILAHTDHPKVVAIGEAGLDYFYDNGDPVDQAKGFRAHIAVARETGLPLVIHTRDAEEDTANILREEMENGAFPFLLHCFTASQNLADIAVSLGGYVSFSGVLTFKKSEELRAVAASLPVDRILVETDAPYLAPVPKRGKPNEPSYVAHTASVLGETRGLSSSEIAKVTSDNFFRLFSKVPDPRS
jgi:TatD DNase family protein